MSLNSRGFSRFCTVLGGGAFPQRCTRMGVSIIPLVLVVEDHDAVARALTRFLPSRGIEIWAVVETGEAALAELAARRTATDGPDSLPDLALVDVSLPGISGVELVARLTEEYPELPCLMLSADEGYTSIVQSLNSGARGYVPKRDPQMLLDGIWGVLEGEEK